MVKMPDIAQSSLDQNPVLYHCIIWRRITNSSTSRITNTRIVNEATRGVDGTASLRLIFDQTHLSVIIRFYFDKLWMGFIFILFFFCFLIWRYRH